MPYLPPCEVGIARDRGPYACLESSPLSRNSLTYNIDSHSNSIVCLPVLGNRSAVWVGIYVFSNRGNGQSFETDLLNEVKTFLNRWGIHQR
jgi:hypothetical protein